MDPRLRSSRCTLCVAIALLAAAPASAGAAPDPLIDQQWALGNGGIGAQQAWSRSDGGGIVVAVLDSGIQIDHPDLAGSVWTNPREIAGNGRDDDANKIIDDVNGANMLVGSNAIADDNGHGTHVAGIVAAHKDNGVGGSGIAPGVKIMPIKVLDATMRGNTTALSLGIRYAVDNGAQILNVSINGDESSALLEDAVRYASDRGATIVASAGNNARNLDLVPSYPAVLPNPAMLTVAATDPTSTLASISNFGPQSVELGAPGEHILSTALGSGYEMRVGTSMAAPFVSGSLALLAAARPDLGQSELRTALLATVRRPAALISKIQDGTLDVGAAMARLAGVAPAVDAAAGESAGPRLRTGKRTRAGRRATLRWSAGTVQDVSVWRVSLDHRVVARVKVGATLRVQRRIERAGRHRWRVVGLDASAAKLTSATRSFRVIARR